MPLSEIGKTAVGMTFVITGSLGLYYVLQKDLEAKRLVQMKARQQKRREKAKRLREAEEAGSGATDSNIAST